MTSWTDYSSGTWDELIGPEGTPHPHARAVAGFLAELGAEGRGERRRAAEHAIRQMGITFTVYSSAGNIDREWPFDIIPRVIAAAEWRRVERGLTQRLEALNLFIDDLYNDQHVLNDGVVPRELIESSRNFRRECIGVRPPHGVWAHICGSDLVRGADGTLHVLEDNLRVPSGVSYMIENREVMKRTFPEVFGACRVAPVDDYPGELQRMLGSLSPREEPVLVVLTPGVFNSAYFEHVYLAQQIGAELVEGRDLVVEDDVLYVRNVDGLERVDVVYRRVDDAWIDPEVFEPESMLGVAGLMRAWKAGNVAIANAPGRRGRRRQGRLLVRARHRALLPRRGPDHRERADVPLRGPGHARPRARAPRGARGQARQRVRRLRHADRAALHARGARRDGAPHRGRPQELDRAADPRDLDHADDVRGRRPRPARRPAPVRAAGREARGHHRRAHTGRARRGLARRELVPGRRQQGHLDRRDGRSGRAGRRARRRRGPRAAARAPRAEEERPRGPPGAVRRRRVAVDGAGRDDPDAGRRHRADASPVDDRGRRRRARRHHRVRRRARRAPEEPAAARQERREPVLARPLPRTRREHRAADRDARPAADGPAGEQRLVRVALARVDLRRRRAVRDAPRRRRRDDGDALHDRREEKPQLAREHRRGDPLEPSKRARHAARLALRVDQRARAAHGRRRLARGQRDAAPGLPARRRADAAGDRRAPPKAA